jgi:hypothetical protein
LLINGTEITFQKKKKKQKQMAGKLTETIILNDTF